MLKLKELRLKRKLSHLKMAIALDKELGEYRSPQSIRNWELGIRSPKVKDLEILSKFFNVQITFFFNKNISNA